MIISLIILILMIINIYHGWRDGLVYEFIRIISYFVGWLIALSFAHPLGSLLNQFLGMDPVLINGISFLIILIISVLILKSIGQVINRITDLPVLHLLNKIGGALAGLVVGYIIIFILLNLGLALPSAWMQNEYTNSPVALRIINHTPGIANHLTNEWMK